MLSDLPLLSILIWLPILGGLLTLVIGNDNRASVARGIALVTAIISMLACIPLYTQFDITTAAMQFVEKHEWIHAFQAYYALGIDGIAMPLIVLTTFTTLLVIVISLQSIKTQVSQYMAAFLIMQGTMIGVFAATDALLFYVFWEAMLIPIFLIIGIWGGKNRTYASIKFFLYTFFGSVLMLTAILYLTVHSQSLDIQDFYTTPLNLLQQCWIFLAFLLAFAVKVPMWPVHTWLPDAHTEAPAGGSVVLAAVMLKMGIYGFFRFSLPITPDAALHWHHALLIISLIAIVYIGLVAIVQTDMKRLIAYSSVSHMGLVTLGCFMIYDIVAATHNISDATMSLEGAMVQMVSHAFSTGALFVGIGILYEVTHSRLIKDYGGVVNTMPLFTSFMLVFAMTNVGLPGTSGFIGEFMIILNAFKSNFWVAFFAAITLILSAAYTLWMFKRVFFGEVANDTIAALKDITWIDKMTFGVLTAMIIALGVYPQMLLKVMHPTIEHLLNLALMSKVTL